MDYKAKLQLNNNELEGNNVDLQTILDTINNLPEAGSGGTDTSDATAVAEDIMSGKTAYVANGKITGSFTIDDEISAQDNLIAQLSAILDDKASANLDTSDATATAEDIVSGKTAYVNGNKIIGSHECSGGVNVELITVNWEVITENDNLQDVEIIISYDTINEMNESVRMRATGTSGTIQCKSGYINISTMSQMISSGWGEEEYYPAVRNIETSIGEPNSFFAGYYGADSSYGVVEASSSGNLILYCY